MCVLTVYVTVAICVIDLWLDVLPVCVCSFYTLYACVSSAKMSLIR